MAAATIQEQPTCLAHSTNIRALGPRADVVPGQSAWSARLGTSARQARV